MPAKTITPEPHVWYETTRYQPEMVKTMGGHDDKWEHSEYVIGRYAEKYHFDDDLNRLNKRILRMEKRYNPYNVRWYCPATKQHVFEPSHWIKIPEEASWLK